MATTAYDFDATALDGTPQPLSDWRGKVLLIVNVASKCGFTPQYAGLEKLWRDYGDKRPGGARLPVRPVRRTRSRATKRRSANFCSLTYDVSFPMFAKIDVNGAHAHPLWTWLKDEKGGLLGTEGIKWNFTKFLVDRDGKVIERYAPTDKPESLARDIEKALG
jgi:glutathione peroxidase